MFLSSQHLCVLYFVFLRRSRCIHQLSLSQPDGSRFLCCVIVLVLRFVLFIDCTAMITELYTYTMVTLKMTYQKRMIAVGTHYKNSKLNATIKGNVLWTTSAVVKQKIYLAFYYLVFYICVLVSCKLQPLMSLWASFFALVPLTFSYMLL